jgi:hypothetical protein
MRSFSKPWLISRFLYLKTIRFDNSYQHPYIRNTSRPDEGYLMTSETSPLVNQQDLISACASHADLARLSRHSITFLGNLTTGVSLRLQSGVLVAIPRYDHLLPYIRRGLGNQASTYLNRDQLRWFHNEVARRNGYLDADPDIWQLRHLAPVAAQLVRESPLRIWNAFDGERGATINTEASFSARSGLLIDLPRAVHNAALEAVRDDIRRSLGL